jgi:hypothetical protein
LAKTPLVVEAPDDGTMIEVLDAHFRTVPLAQNLGKVSVELEPGVYGVRFRRGNSLVERPAVLMPGGKPIVVTLRDVDAPHFATAAPLRRTSTTREYHRAPAQALSKSSPIPAPTGQSGGSQLLVFVRDVESSNTKMDVGRSLTVHDHTGRKVCDLAAVGRRNLEERWAGVLADLDPGLYRIRGQGKGSFTEQVVYTAKDWQTQVFLFSSRPVRPDDLSVDLSSMSLLMARSSVGFDFERPDLRSTEAALHALTRTDGIPGGETDLHHWESLDNPILGVYAALLHLRRPTVDVDLVRAAITRLIAMFGRPTPDILAIAFGLANRKPELRDDVLFRAWINLPGTLRLPPMLRESWRHIVTASRADTALVPGDSLAGRLGAVVVPSGPWLAWSGDPPPQEEQVVSAAEAVPDTVALTAASTKSAARRKPSFIDALGGLLGEWFARPALVFALNAVRNTLKKDTEVGYLLYASRFTPLERRLAQLVDPLVDPTIRSLIDKSPALRKTLETHPTAKAGTAPNVLAALNVPASTALSTAWGLFRKLYLQPILPNVEQRQFFARSEAMKYTHLTKVLTDLQLVPTALKHRRSGRAITGLEFITIAYRGAPGLSWKANTTPKSVAEHLAEGEYSTASGEPITSLDVKNTFAALRPIVVAALEAPEVQANVTFRRGWRQRVLGSPARYQPGQLFKGVAVPPPEDTTATSSSGPTGTPTAPQLLQAPKVSVTASRARATVVGGENA